VQTSAPDLLICDASLAGIDGYGVVEAVREQEATGRLPVLLLASDHHRPDVDRLDHLGIQDLLTKPFEQHDLLERVRGLLGGKPEPTRTNPPETPATAPPATASPGPGAEPAWERPASLHGGESPPLDDNVRRVLEGWLRGEGRSLVDAALREVIWKVVPELAEAQIRDEIRRLTEPEDTVDHDGEDEEEEA
jgi:DNA-binding response OmpR family regulator